jgi:protein-L-isoaspartate(D-aspartate) O-methyltransferase
MQVRFIFNLYQNDELFFGYNVHMTMNANEQHRFNMIEQQIRTWEVLDPEVLNLLHQVPREKFVPTEYQGVAFADTEIPLLDEVCMLAPKLEARLIQSLSLQKKNHVLVVGSGSGYLTALTASLVKNVVSVDINPYFTKLAKQNCQKIKLNNIEFVTGDGSLGWLINQPYDAILFTGSLPYLPESIRNQLNVNGRILAILGEAPSMQATLITRLNNQDFEEEVLFETVVPSLHVKHENTFVF